MIAMTMMSEVRKCLLVMCVLIVKNVQGQQYQSSEERGLRNPQYQQGIVLQVLMETISG